MKIYSSFAFFALTSIANFLVLVFLAGTNRLATNDEARHISAGIFHWRNGGFELANDVPPLARMVAVMPLLPLNVRSNQAVPEARHPDVAADTLDRELNHAGEFLHLNPEPFNLVLLARMTGFGWWLLGALVIFSWASAIYGGKSGYLGVVLWSSCPIVLGFEQIATPELPAAVACLAATYAFRGHLLLPSWNKSLLVGLLLGVALLTDFASLALLVIFPLLGLASRLGRGDCPSPPAEFRNRVLRGGLTIGSCLGVVNMGYGFDRSGSPLAAFDFASRALAGTQRPVGEPRLGTATGNRFRRSRIGRAIVPVPAEYLEGLDRRWHEWETPHLRDGEDKGPVEVGGRSPSAVGGDWPVSLRIILLGCLILAAKRHPGDPPLAEELTLWVPASVFMAMSTRVVDLLPPASGTLLAIPFAIIIAGGVNSYWSSKRRVMNWLAIGLSAWCVGDCMKTTHDRFFPPNRTTRFRQDLVRQGRKVGLDLPESRMSSGTGSGERGLIYRTFTDSIGDQVNYALHVPKSYRGDRPFPLILFLHGWGDRKKSPTDRMYAEVGLPFTLKYRSIDFLVVCPQGLSGIWKANGDDARKAMELLAYIQKQYRVDPKRISLTGLSSGGSGVWALAAQDPSRWAAIVPVAGSCDPDQAPPLKDLPCWCFHNRYDKGPPAQQPRQMIEALKRLGGSPLYTEYSDTNHGAWERAYVLPELYDWLSRQRTP